MLNKEICKSCINRNVDSMNHKPWGSADDAQWEKGNVHCYGNFCTQSQELPPSWCFYLFEHLVSAGMNDAQ